MKNTILAIACLLFIIKSHAQNVVVITPNSSDSRVITTGVPFLLIATDARAAAMGDMGVATSVDAFSQQWNPSKYAFDTNKQSVAVSYTPYLSQLVKDIFIGSLVYHNRLNERSAFSTSLRYFSVGDIEFVETAEATPFIQKPTELTIDAAYALKLSEQFAMSVAMRYLRSDLKLTGIDGDATAANTFGVDISGFYQSEEEAYNSFNGRTRLGFAIQNIGPKFKYTEGGVENFQPTILRLGGGFDFILDDYNKIAVTGELTKFLVPTPPILGNRFEYEDVDENGEYDSTIDNVISDVDNYIIEGKDPDVSFISGMFQSFGDAPGGFSEEIKEFTYAIGAEYMYQNSFAFRTGYFNESDDKGARKFFALGAGFKFSSVTVDLSYLFSASKVPSPLENTLRFSLAFNLGPDTYSEY